MTQEEMDQLFSTLADIFDVLGWKVAEPTDLNNVDGFVVGTPEYLEAWDEIKAKRKDELL